jgi:hypothetical protein
MKLRTFLVTFALFALLAAPMAAQDSSTVGAFTLTFNGVTYGSGTSTWSYSIVWNGTPPALSHLTIGFCATSGATVVSSSPPHSSVGTDPTTGVFGIKWEGNSVNGIVAGVSYDFSFTLNQAFAVASVPWAPKAGTNNATGLIYGPSCDIVNPSIAISKSCPAAAFVGDVIEYDITVTNDGNVPLTDVVISDPGATPSVINVGSLAAGASANFTVTIAAAAAGTISNTASVTSSYAGSEVSDTSDSCDTEVYEPTVTKDAATSYDRDYDWVVTKEFDGDEPVEICSGMTAQLAFTISAERTAVDSPYMVTGNITVDNPATIALVVNSLDDVLPGATVDVDCGATTFPATIAAGGSLQCTYSAIAGSLAAAVNTATAVYETSTRSFDDVVPLGTASVDGTADVTFGDPDTVSDESIDVTDLVTCPDGFTCTGAGPFQFSGSGTESFEIDVTNDSAMCDSFFTLTNTVSWTDDEEEATSSVDVEIYTCACSYGCTLTIGYWKTHAGFTGRNADRVTQYLPILLGSIGGAKTVEVDTAEFAVEVLSFKLGGASNGIAKLYAQLLAAKLNIANGASPDDVAAIILDADAFLAIHDHNDWRTLSKAQKATVLTWMTLLDGYNNGDLGPGHCD